MPLKRTAITQSQLNDSNWQGTHLMSSFSVRMASRPCLDSLFRQREGKKKPRPVARLPQLVLPGSAERQPIQLATKRSGHRGVKCGFIRSSQAFTVRSSAFINRQTPQATYISISRPCGLPLFVCFRVFLMVGIFYFSGLFVSFLSVCFCV